jgi:DnaJ-class molecular chaperone
MDTQNSDICPKCHGTGVVKEKDGTIHTCYDCLQRGSRMFEQHGNPKDSGIKL